MNAYLDNLALRTVSFRYSCPPVCLYEFSSTGSQTVVLAPLEFKKGPTGVSVNRLSGGLRFSWNAYPGVICYSVYKLEDPQNPNSPYVVVAQCITSTELEIPEEGCETYIVTALTPDGETASSDTFTVGPDCEAQVKWNTVQTGHAECAAHYVGAPTSYVVAANLFGAKTQEEADAKALAYANEKAALALECLPDGAHGGGGGGAFAPRLGDWEFSSWCVGSDVFDSIEVTDGVLPISYTYSGLLPGGTHLTFPAGMDASALIFLEGKADAAGFYSFSISATDSAKPIARKTVRNYGINVSEIVTETLPDACIGVQYSVTLEQDSGLEPVVWKVVSGTLPAWATLNEDTGEITGTPDVVSQNQFTVRLE